MSADDPNQGAAPKAPVWRMRLVAYVAYGVGMALSLTWGISYDLFYDRGLQGEVRLGATAEGSTYVTVRNGGRADWNDVKVEADGAWFVRFDTIQAGAQRDARLREFENAYRLPRPGGVYFFEQVGIPPEPDFAPADLRPSRVRVTCDLGEFAAEVGL